jgi:hypothetical protein
MITALVLMCFGIKAIAANPDVCYVKTSDKVYFGQDVKVRPLHTKVISADGTIETIHTNDVKAYMHDSKLYELKPLVCEKGDTICYAFMEFIDSRSGLNLYRYKCCIDCNVQYAYFVFTGDKLYLRVNQICKSVLIPEKSRKEIKDMIDGKNKIKKANKKNHD